MTCNEIRPHLLDYAWQRLSAAEAGAVDTHLGRCAECRAILEEERALGQCLAAVPVASPRTDLWDSVRLRQMALQNAASAPRRVRPGFVAMLRDGRFATPAARHWAAALGAGVAALVLMLAPSRPTQDVATAPAQEIATGPAPGARIIARTLDQARSVARQSDNPLGDVTDSTWDALAVSHEGAPS